MTSETTIRRPPPSRRSRPGLFVHVVRSPDAAALGRTLRLDGQSFSFGRDVKGPGRIADPTLSRVHFGLRPRGGVERYEVEDLGGTNGTFVDGARLTEPRTLTGNEVLMAGETLLVVEREPPPESLPSAHDADGTAAATFRGRSIFADRIRRALETAATTDAPVLLLGPTGAGKEVAARAIHAASGRRGPFVAVNCAAIPAELAESEFFGHKKGAFTGAESDRVGRFVEADRGTLFLDEIGELPAPLQAKLLRVLETREVHPVGGERPIAVDVRIVAATLVDVEREEHGFRRDLLGRLGDWILRLPLSARRADVLPLFDELFPGEPPARTVEFDAALLLYDWPLNVRGLKKLAQRLARLAPPGARLDLPDLPPELQSPLLAELDREPPPEAAPRRVEIPSKEELEEALRAAGGNIKRLAGERGWHRMQIYRWMERYGLNRDDYR